MKDWAKTVVRSAAARLGYTVLHRGSMRYGYDPYLDIRRISRAWQTDVETIFDVGANVGDTSRECAKAFERASIWSFEPHPDTFRVLGASTKDHPRIRCFNMAFADKPGQLDLIEYSKSLVNSFVAASAHNAHYGYEPIGKQAVRTDTLDAFCRDHGVDRIDLLKIDTEGFDAEVLLGAEHLLRARKIRFVYVEYNAVNVARSGSGTTLSEVDRILTSFGYDYLSSYTDYIDVDRPASFGVFNALYAVHPDLEPPG